MKKRYFLVLHSNDLAGQCKGRNQADDGGMNRCYLKATGPQDSPLPPGQALAKITQPPGKGAKLGKGSHLLTTL